MVAAGVEVSVGIVRDEAFGPLVVVAAGGTLVELLADRVVACPPVTRKRGRSACFGAAHRAAAGRLARAPPVDVDALAEVVVAFSQMAIELGEVLDAVEANPVIASPNGVVAVDALGWRWCTWREGSENRVDLAHRVVDAARRPSTLAGKHRHVTDADLRGLSAVGCHDHPASHQVDDFVVLRVQWEGPAAHCQMPADVPSTHTSTSWVAIGSPVASSSGPQSSSSASKAFARMGVSTAAVTGGNPFVGRRVSGKGSDIGSGANRLLRLRRSGPVPGR